MRRKEGREVTVVDLDIINPYFRLADGGSVLNENAIKSVFPVFANTNVDIPALSAELSGILSQDTGSFVFVDVGGDETGAVALGCYRNGILRRGYEMLLAANRFRPYTQTPSETVEVMRLIESASRLSFTGIAANPNLGADTTAETVISSLPFYSELSGLTGLPVVFTAVREDLFERCAPKIKGRVIPLKIFTKPGWEIY